ncbi:alpha/beta hydrolase [Kitasatospora sp. NPDC048365]|uniref:alpha/beta hydrolase n=1 Tax=Kitasatospora sp. NPDC048365 TaxID=3364050 RepID=UPI00371E4692
MTAVYRGFGQAELDREYSPSSMVADMGAELAHATAVSESAYRELTVRRDLPYGPGAPERTDFFPAEGADGPAPLHVYVHGGYWQELDKTDSAFAAPDLVRRGAAFAAVGYGLAPGWDLDAIVGQVRRAVLRLLDDAEQLGVDPARVWLSGSSAGAHLVAMALLDPRIAGRVAGAVLLSGVYDLEPIALSYVNEPLGLDADGARRNSPLHLLANALPEAGLPPLVIALGEHETAEFGRQQAEFAAAARAAGTALRELVVKGRNHFDLPLDLGRTDTELGAAVAELTGA